MRSLLRVKFHPDVVTLCVRPPKPHECDALEDFECHASGCAACSQLTSPSPATLISCAEGSHKARALRRSLYTEHGRVYEVPRKGIKHKVVVETHPVFRMARGLLRATEHAHRRRRGGDPHIQAPAQACRSNRPLQRCQYFGCRPYLAFQQYTNPALAWYQAGHCDSTTSEIRKNRQTPRRSADGADGGTSYVRVKVLSQPEQVFHPQSRGRKLAGDLHGHSKKRGTGYCYREPVQRTVSSVRDGRITESTHQESKITVVWD
jgi:hypothetical protein